MLTIFSSALNINFDSSIQEETNQLVEVFSEISEKMYSVLLESIWKTGKVQKLRNALGKSCSWRDWSETARELDEIEGKDNWKMREQTSLYDYKLLRRRLRLLRQARKSGDIEELVHTLRSGLIRNIGGCLNPQLYTHSLLGTKQLILDYQEEVSDCLWTLFKDPEYPLKNKLSFFTDARYAYGRSALLLSGGANLAMYHLGVIRCMREHGLLPKVIAGSSVGALIAGIVCSFNKEDLDNLLNEGKLDFSIFSGLEKGGLIRKIKRFFKDGHMLDIDVLQNFMRQNIGDITFKEAYDKTGLILNITVAQLGDFDSYRLLNYLTAPHVLIWSAGLASCAMPYVFPAIELKCKDANGRIVPFYPSGLKFIDGSIKADLPMQRLAELFNVNHFIVSQTNPWVVPFYSEGNSTLKTLCLMEFRHWVTVLKFLGIHRSINTLLELFSQENGGHVTIWPVASITDYAKLLNNPTQADILKCVRRGLTRTFPKMNILQGTMKIENTFEACYEEVKKLLQVQTFVNSDLRRLFSHPLTSFD